MVFALLLAIDYRLARYLDHYHVLQEVHGLLGVVRAGPAPHGSTQPVDAAIGTPGTSEVAVEWGSFHGRATANTQRNRARCVPTHCWRWDRSSVGPAGVSFFNKTTAEV